jgi:DNA-binding transcriptional regulator YiaG
MEKKFKYESEALGVIHEEALESFRIGAISEARMREYDAMCLIQPPTATVPRVATQKAAPAFASSGAPVYARGK